MSYRFTATTFPDHWANTELRASQVLFVSDGTRQVDSMLSYLSLDAWQTFVESHDDATVFHHRSWIELILEQYAGQAVIPALVEDGRVLAGLPLIESKGLLTSQRLVCLPFTDCMRPLSHDPGSLDRLMRAIRQELRLQYDTVVARTDQAFFQVPSESPWVRHEVDTSLPLTEVVDRFATQARQNWRKAGQLGLTYRSSRDPAAVNEFYRLHLKTRKKVGVPIQPKGFFRLLQQRLIENGLGHTALVVLNGQVISAAVMLHFKRVVMCKYLASDPRHLDLRPNDFLTFCAIQQAVESGYATFDFGISKRSQHGLRRFKRKWGAREIDVFYDQIVGNSLQVPLDESAAVRIAGTAIRHSPELLCRTLGEIFYRFGR